MKLIALALLVVLLQLATPVQAGCTWRGYGLRLRKLCCTQNKFGRSCQWTNSWKSNPRVRIVQNKCSWRAYGYRVRKFCKTSYRYKRGNKWSRRIYRTYRWTNNYKPNPKAKILSKKCSLRRYGRDAKRLCVVRYRIGRQTRSWGEWVGGIITLKKKHFSKSVWRLYGYRYRRKMRTYGLKVLFKGKWTYAYRRSRWVGRMVLLRIRRRKVKCTWKNYGFYYKRKFCVTTFQKLWQGNWLNVTQMRWTGRYIALKGRNCLFRYVRWPTRVRRRCRSAWWGNTVTIRPTKTNKCRWLLRYGWERKNGRRIRAYFKQNYCCAISSWKLNGKPQMRRKCQLKGGRKRVSTFTKVYSHYRRYSNNRVYKRICKNTYVRFSKTEVRKVTYRCRRSGPFIKVKNYKSCASYTDPHYRDIAGRGFSNQFVGAQVLGRSKHFIVHTKTATYARRYSANVVTGILVNGKTRLVFRNKNNKIVYINGRKRVLKNGENKFKGFKIIRDNKHYIFIHAGREFINLRTSTINRAYIKTGYFQSIFWSGWIKNYALCGLKHKAIQAKGVITKPGKLKLSDKMKKWLKKKTCSRKQKKIARRLCRKHYPSLKSQGWKDCITDVCNGIPVKTIVTMAKFAKKYKRVAAKYAYLSRANKKIAAKYLDKAQKMFALSYTHLNKALMANYRALGHKSAAQTAFFLAHIHKSAHLRSKRNSRVHTARFKKYMKLYRKYNNIANKAYSKRNYYISRIKSCRTRRGMLKYLKKYNSEYSIMYNALKGASGEFRKLSYYHARRASYHNRMAKAYNKIHKTYVKKGKKHVKLANKYHKLSMKHARKYLKHKKAAQKHSKTAKTHLHRAIKYSKAFVKAKKN